jgi:hypothetical protein
MAVDIQRVVLAAVEAGLGDDKPEKSKGLSAGKAVAVGAVLVTAGRIAAKPGGRFVKEKLRDRLSDGSESDESHEYHEDDAYDEAEAESDTGEEPEAEFDEREGPEAEEGQEPEPEEDQEAEEDEKRRAEEDKRAAAEASEEDEPDAGQSPYGGPGSDGERPDDEGPDEPEAEGDEDAGEDVEDGSDAPPSKTRPRPPIFDRPGASGSKIRPAARPPVAKKKQTSRLKNRSRPGRPRHPRTPLGRT